MGFSLRPSEAVEGGAVPVDRNLTVKEARFDEFTYTKKDGTVVMKQDGSGPAVTTTIRLTVVDDAGGEYVQHYSMGDPSRFPVDPKDNRFLAETDEDVPLSKSSNAYAFLDALVKAGFPENKLGKDISVLDGLYAYFMGVPEPKRSGLNRPAPAEGAREKILAVPSQILRLPWDKASKTAGAKGAAPAKGKEDGAVVEKAMELVKDAVEEMGGSVTRKQLTTRVFKKLGKDPSRDAISSLVFDARFPKVLADNGFVLEGEEITAAK